MFKKKKVQPTIIQQDNAYTNVTTEQVISREKTASVRPLPTGRGPIPVAPASARVQLTPIVNPVAFVPYSTQKQPLLTFDDIVAEDEEI